MHIQTSHATLVGDRANNEDFATVVADGGGVLLVVADGMGGHDHGELASEAAVTTIARAFPDRGDDPGRYLTETLEHAHRAVFELGRSSPIDLRPRTTCVVALIERGEAWFAHAGDSRAYLIRAGSVVARTRDHSHVESMVADGEISERDAERHPLRNIVERCLGGEAERVEAELAGPYPLENGDVVLLCSDGFWEGVEIPAAGASLAGADDLKQELERLVAGACAVCAPHADNATAAVLRYTTE